MSHYLNVETQITDPEALVQALQRMQWKGQGGLHIEQHATAHGLYGYQNDLRKDKAHIIVRKKYVGTSSNDIGFVKNAKGNYEAIISEYDRNHLEYNSSWLHSLEGYYGLEKSKKEATAKGLKFFEDTDEKNRPRLRIKVPSGGSAYEN